MSPRVVLVTSAFPADSEGFIVDKFLGLLDAGFDVHVLTSAHGPLDPYPELSVRRDEVERRVHPVQPADLAARLAGAATMPGRAARFVGRELRRGRPHDARVLHGLRLLSLRPDLVHFEFGWNAEQLARVAPLLDCPIVVSIRGADVNYVGLDQPGYYDEMWAAVDVVHCLGADLLARSRSRGCPPTRRHVLIPPAVDVDRFDPRPRPPHDGPLRIVSVGRLHWKKGHEYALQAVALARAQGVDLHLRILGDGPHRAAVEAEVADLDLEASVTLAGTTSRDDVRDVLQWADVFLHAAVSEGFGNAVLEAQAMALPVVTSDADGLGENVVDGETGYVVPRRDPAAMAGRLVDLAADPALREQMGAAGRRRVVTSFRPVDQVAAFVALYRELLGA